MRRPASDGAVRCGWRIDGLHGACINLRAQSPPPARPCPCTANHESPA